jgi:hypothetical protein
MMGLNKRLGMTLLGCAALTATLPSIASADDRGGRYHDARASDRCYRERDHHDRGRDRDSRTDVRIDINLGRPRYEPVYEERTTRVWMEPVYRTVCDRVWVEPVYRTECDRVWVPDRFEYRDVVYRDRHGRRVIRQERVCVERGHWQTAERQVLVCEGYWKTIERQELVHAGHWEYRTERVQVGEAPRYGGGVIDLFASLRR